MKSKSKDLLTGLREGKDLSFRDEVMLTLRLSFPAMLAQLSFILMEYIDASMVGRLGAEASASIGLISTSTWLFHGICTAITVGFTVQAAQMLGGGREEAARNLMKEGLLIALGISLFLMALGLAIHSRLPGWLGGKEEICADASRYFLIFSLSLPMLQLNSIAGGMLQSSGNMKLPSMLNMMMCLLDVLLNSLLIFPARRIDVLGHMLTLPGAGMGTAGAALGTALAASLTALPLCGMLLFRSPVLRLRAGEALSFSAADLKKALKIAAPVGFEQIVMCGAYVASTCIVAPLGNISIAAHSFSITAESLCYMPGYGIGAAASTMIGQSIGAGRSDLSRRLGWICTGLGMAIMSLIACLMYAAAPGMIGLLSPDPEIRALGASVLRIEAFAEPFYAASIVASGVFRGAGDTLVPSAFNFLSMWLVRIPLSLLLATSLGLRGVWIAMCVELCFRGILFLLRLKSSRWLRGEAASAASK